MLATRSAVAALSAEPLARPRARGDGGARSSLVVLSLTGRDRPGQDAKRDAVAAYIDEVNAAQRVRCDRASAGQQGVRAVRAPIRRVSRATLPTSTARRGRCASSTRRLRALEPPPDAAELAPEARRTLGRRGGVRLRDRPPRPLPAGADRGAPGGRRGGREATAGACRCTRRCGAGGGAGGGLRRFCGCGRRGGETAGRRPVPTALRPVRAQEIARIGELSESARSLAKALRQGRNAGDGRAGESLQQGRGGERQRDRAKVRDRVRCAGSTRSTRSRLGVAKERARLDRELR